MTRERIQSGNLTKLAGAALIAGAAAFFTASTANAQLKPWDDSNEVLVDLSVLGDGGGGLGPDAGTGVFLPSLVEELLDPPRRTPASRLLVPRPPAGGASAQHELPKVKLISPSEQWKRAAKAKRKPSPKVARKKKTPVRVASKPTRKLKPAPKPAAKTAKAPLAPAPPAKPKPKVSVGTAPPPPAIAAAPPAAPSLPKAAPPKPPAAKAEPKATPQPVQQASRPPEPRGPQTVNVLFASGASSLTAGTQKNLDGVAAQLKANDSVRLQLLAYAGEPNMSPSKARRLSLSRALRVRSYLIKQGVRSTRIDVRALGNKVPSGQPSRVDLKVLGN